MAMAGLDDITTALKVRLATIVVNDRGDKLSAYAIEPPSPQFPCAYPFFRRPAADYGQTFDGGMTWHVTITVAVRAADLGHAQTNLWPFLSPTGPKSIMAAIESDVTLGLPGVSASVLRVEEIGPLQIAGSTAWGATLPMDIMVDDE